MKKPNWQQKNGEKYLEIISLFTVDVMAKFSPQQSAFKYSKTLNNINGFLLVASILLPFGSLLVIEGFWFDASNIVNFFVLISYTISTYILSYYLLPESEKIRRSDYFSNTFGIHTRHSRSQDYYTNDDIDDGFYKMAVNLFENLFFSYNVSRKMIKKGFGKLLILALPLVYFAYIGFHSNLYAQSFLQIFLSILILGDAIKLLIYHNNVSHMIDEIEGLFGNKDFPMNIGKYTSALVRLYTNYESNISWAGIMFDSKIFSEENPKLTKEWNTLKKKYHISGKDSRKSKKPKKK